MALSDQEIEDLAFEKYPINNSLLGSCSGLKNTDKNAYERKIWIDGFKEALKYSKETHGDRNE